MAKDANTPKDARSSAKPKDRGGATPPSTGTKKVKRTGNTRKRG